MITLLTGLPGNGKTLFALPYIKAKAEKDTREVYYSGITILDKDALPWSEFKPEEWMNLPHGSIIVIDEAQFVFSKKPNGSKLPDFYEQLATHRHRGFDIFLITQHPSLLDNFVRQLVGQHFHSVRKFGLERSTVYEWSAANASPQSISSQKSAIPMKWAYPKEVYGWYKSAEVHTVKRSIPLKLFLAVGFIVALLGAGYWSLDRYQHRFEKFKPDASSQAHPSAAGPVAAGVSSPGTAQTPEFDPVADAKHYVAMQTPRIVGLPQTAPKYDALTVPTRVPIPAACVQIGSVNSSSSSQVKCKCFSQQGTPMPVEFNMCIEFARNGFFQEFDADRDRVQVARSEAGQAVIADRPDQSIRGGGAQVVAFAAPDPAPKPVSRLSSSSGSGG